MSPSKKHQCLRISNLQNRERILQHQAQWIHSRDVSIMEEEIQWREASQTA
jgi:hypothetical protein